ncbi:uncharacterized protein LOC126795936 [Argentina anserina]|uniref:uncharacterized protein LOC126795936 n=1 Tax=Argentina anserina TaxID=57926 RepID=UPI002176292A|nr:uncharacterized protein LOC126795936 [Potentilla anserina]
MKNEKQIDDREGQEEEDETEKMEQFYSLIKQFREARNRLIRSRKTRLIHDVGDEEEPEKMKSSKKRKTMGGEDGERQRRSSGSSWVPSFECEDFAIKEVGCPVTSPSFPAFPCNTNTNTVNNGKKKLEDDDASVCVDLRLAL